MGIFRLLKFECKVAKNYARKSLKSEKNKKRDFKNIKMLFELTKKSEYTIDDNTWDNICMNDLFTKIDRTCSSVGEAALYTMLRNPSINEEELEKNSGILEHLRSDDYLKSTLNKIFRKIGFDEKNALLNMLTSKFLFNEFKGILYKYMCLIPLILILCGIILKDFVFIIICFIYMLFTIYIHDIESKNTKLYGLTYLRKLLTGAKSIVRLENNYIKDQSEEIQILLKELESIDKNTFIIKIINYFGKFTKMISIPFLIEESLYYKINREISDKAQIILNLYYLVGKIDAFLSVDTFKESNKYICTKPIFIKDKHLIIKDGIYPLLKKPVSNSIEIKSKGIILNGTNMCGKSTFLKMISINIILAQTFNFVLAKRYKGCFFYVSSSISNSNYYIEEAENILKIINSTKKEIPVFCFLDEIFKGIGTMERIAACIQIFKYINNSNSLCIAVSNDKEVYESLKDDYDFYHFKECLNKKEGLIFNYTIEKGILNSKNTIKFLDYIGYPKCIIEDAYKTCDGLLEDRL